MLADEVDGAVVLKATKAVAAGEELFLDYKPGVLHRPDASLFLYGFVQVGCGGWHGPLLAYMAACVASAGGDWLSRTCALQSARWNAVHALGLARVSGGEMSEGETSEGRNWMVLLHRSWFNRSQ